MKEEVACCTNCSIAGHDSGCGPESSLPKARDSRGDVVKMRTLSEE